MVAHQLAEAQPTGVVAVDRDYEHTGAQDDSVQRPTVNCYLQDQAQIVHTEVITYLNRFVREIIRITEDEIFWLAWDKHRIQSMCDWQSTLYSRQLHSF